MKDQYKEILNRIGDIITASGYYDSQCEDEGRNMPAEEAEFYRVLDFCYELLARTSINADAPIETPDILKEPGETKISFITKHPIRSGADLDFAFAIASGKGSVNFRGLFDAIIRKNCRTISQVCQATAQGQPNMSRYLARKQTIYADNLEKAINYVLNSKHLPF